MKRDLKNKITDKKSIGKRRGGTSNYRSINNQIYDKVPNDNLYKNDNLYSINKNFEFSPKEESMFCLFYHYNYQINEIKGILILFYLRFLSWKINTILDFFSFFKIFNLKNIFHLLSFCLSFFLTHDKHINKANMIVYYLFLVNQCLHVYNIYNKLGQNYEYYIAIMPELVFNFCFLFFLATKLKEVLIPISLILLIYFFSVKRNFYFLLFISCIVGSVFSFLLYVLFKKTIREIWALFDSFKRSYYNINKGLLDSDPNPVFIISKDKKILHRNAAASKLVNNILENANTQNKLKRNKNDKLSNMSFLDIIHPNLKELFNKVLNDVMEDDKVDGFNFPLCKINNQNLDIDVSYAYDIFNEKNYLYFIWFNTIVCKTEWKGKPAFYMYFFPCEDILLNEIFYQYTKRFSEKIEKVISNSDIICNALINKKKKEKKNESASSSSSMKSDDKNSELTEEGEDDDECRGSAKKILKKNIYQLLVDNADNIELKNTILFFFKNQVELLFDYSLTIEMYFNMLYKKRNFKFCIENTKPNLKKKIKLNELKNYYSEYFYDFTKEHQYKLQFKSEEENNNYDIFIEENYLRIIMFNIIVFMICYLDDKKEPSSENRKEILIKIIPELIDDISITPELGTNRDYNYNKTPNEFPENDKKVKEGKIAFIFESFSTKADLNKIKDLISQEKNFGYHLKSEIIKLNFLDVGILSVNYLLENYYKTKMEISNKEGEQSIQFKLPCDLELISDINNNIKKENQLDLNPEANIFFTSPLLTSKRKINKPKNFYNYNRNYNSKVLNIFYGIEKSPSHKRHIREVPSLTHLTEIDTLNKKYARHRSQHFIYYLDETKKPRFKDIMNDDSENDNKINKANNIDDNQNKNEIKIINITKSKKASKKLINKFSFKQMDFSLDSDNQSFKSERSEKEDISKDEENNILGFMKNKEEEEEIQNRVLIFENQRNKDLISTLNNENQDDYILDVLKDVDQVEKEENNNKYKVLLIDMGESKEIKYAEKIGQNKGDTLIYGYHFGAQKRLREKINVKFDKRFDLSLNYEMIIIALKQLYSSNNNSIIK